VAIQAQVICSFETPEQSALAKGAGTKTTVVEEVSFSGY
jgi:hypothetical protein